MEAEPAKVEITNRFVRHRNALETRASFGPVFMDYYLHLMQHSLKHAPQQDEMLKDAVAALALHLVSRPWDEVVAWTMNIQNPSMNLFVTGNCHLQSITGRIYTEHVKESAENLFFAQVARKNHEPRHSVVPFDGTDILQAAESFYKQSQQLPIRYFRMKDPEEYVLITAMPDCDLEWLEGLTSERVERLAEEEELGHLEKRLLGFGCECTLGKVIQAVTALGRKTVDELFGEEEILEISCPRCSAKYLANREQVRENVP